ncbi:MAG: hypothetical protein ACD_2C00015G0009 [uncultured bacterium (gcode 4)]|uniref:Bacterial type II secretion system protein E domain-containing protein n=1 Tax=uncultured bacterium (gcode 4) TaxID=1234023 RepID=K2H344_9BACT|nr:MAG: hypothetical protein ACD_2C00015G0009 [uncultured bacterium (gcode 4)]
MTLTKETREEIWNLDSIIRKRHSVAQVQSKTRTWVEFHIESVPLKPKEWKKIWEVLIENWVISQENFFNALRKQKEFKNNWRNIPFLQILVELDYIEPQKFLKVARDNNIYVPMWEILTMEWIITLNQLNEALKIQSETVWRRIWQILIEDLKILTEDTLISILSKQYWNLRIRPDLVYFDSKIFFSVSMASIMTHSFVPYNSYEDNDTRVIQVLVNDARRPDIDNITRLVLSWAQNIFKKAKLRVEFCVSTTTEINEFVQAVYVDKEMYLNKKKLRVEDYLTWWDVPVFHIWADYTSEKEIILAFSSIIKKWLDYWASDIHIEPEENKMRIRYRIDWVLKWDSDLPIQMKESLMRWIKYVLWFSDAHKLDKTFDERFKVFYEDKKLHADLRVSILPLLNWDKMVIRLLVQSSEVPSFTDLWMKKNIRIKFQKVCTMASWIIIVTWPTWSWKTTTLFSTINYLKDDKINIVTIEDPPEYLIPGINQAKVRSWHEKNWINYLDALKSTLRQDPDVIMFWEMRDNESASVAMSAWMTWHLLFTTLHTNDAVSSITRLADLWIRPYMLSSTLVSIVAQRLIRKTCDHCKEEYKPTEDDLEFFKVTIDWIDEHIESWDIKFTRWKWCDKCRFTWYKWRIGIYELLCVNEELKKAVLHNATAKEIEDMAREYWMTSMVEDWFLKVIDWLTTLEEVIRVSRTLQAPKRKRTLDEIRYMLEWDLSREEVVASIYSWIELIELEKKQSKRVLKPIIPTPTDEYPHLPIIWWTINTDLLENQKETIVSKDDNVDSLFASLCDWIKSEIVTRLDNVVRRWMDSKSLDKVLEVRRLIAELDNESDNPNGKSIIS